MVEAEALKKFTNIPKYQEIVSVTPTRSRKRHEVLVEFNTPSAITQKKREISLTHQQNDGKLETSNFAWSFPRPEIRKARNFDTRIKDIIATVSYKELISVKKARLKVQTTCRKFYNHFYYLTPKQQTKYEPQLDTIEEESDLEIPPATKKPRSPDIYKSGYRYVLPDRKAVSDSKHKKSLHREIQTARALAS